MLFSRLWIGQWAPRHGGDSRIRSRRHAGSRQGRDGSHLTILLTVAAVFVACVTSAPAGTWMSPPPTRAPARSSTGPRTMVPATLAPAAPSLSLTMSDEMITSVKFTGLRSAMACLRARAGGDYATRGFRRPVNRRISQSTPTAPTKATMMDPMFTPVAPGYPKALKTQPPTMAPTTPSTRSPRRPAGPAPGIAILASQPAMIPTTIHARMLISRSPFLFRWVVICVVYDRSSPWARFRESAGFGPPVWSEPDAPSLPRCPSLASSIRPPARGLPRQHCAQRSELHPRHGSLARGYGPSGVVPGPESAPGFPPPIRAQRNGQAKPRYRRPRSPPLENHAVFPLRVPPFLCHLLTRDPDCQRILVTVSAPFPFVHGLDIPFGQGR